MMKCMKLVRLPTMFALAVMLAVPAASETVVDEDAANAALGLDGSGSFLVMDITKACPVIEPIFRAADPADRILILSDSDVEIVRHASCEGACDMVALNRVMSECQRETGAICAPIAGMHGGVLYDLSFDPNGATLADCGL